jgi:hypothetical protein
VAAAPLAACGLLDPARDPAPDPVADALTGLWRREEGLVARYDAAMAHFPALRPTLAAVRDDHVAHAEALHAVLGARATASPAASPAVSPSSTATPPATAAGLVAELAGHETACAAAAQAAALLAEGDTAALLASVAACEATHLVVLR